MALVRWRVKARPPPRRAACEHRRGGRSRMPIGRRWQATMAGNRTGRGGRALPSLRLETTRNGAVAFCAGADLSLVSGVAGARTRLAQWRGVAGRSDGLTSGVLRGWLDFIRPLAQRRGDSLPPVCDFPPVACEVVGKIAVRFKSQPQSRRGHTRRRWGAHAFAGSALPRLGAGTASQPLGEAWPETSGADAGIGCWVQTLTPARATPGASVFVFSVPGPRAPRPLDLPKRYEITATL